jgi:hypothetical protein
MEKKVCFKCGVEKSLDEYYTHPQMADGHLNKCKECTRKDVRERESELLQDPEWHEKEKKRARDKYFRLGYKDKHKPTYEEKKEQMKKYKEKYPEKTIAKNNSQHVECPEGMHRHHWSYNKEHWKDVIILSEMNHNKFHRYTKYDQERYMYRGLDGVLIDTREKCLAFLEQIKDLD